MPAKLAGAALARSDDGYWSVGGLLEGEASDRVVMLSPGIDTADNAGTELAAFPYPVIGAGAAVMDGRLFVMGGWASDRDGQLVSDLHSLALGDPDADWVRHADLPTEGRRDAALYVLYGELHVFGGSREGQPLADAWGFRLKPYDGSTRTGWRQLRDMPRAAVGAVIYQTGAVHAALMAGQPASAQIDIYHTVTDTWIPGGELPEPVGEAFLHEEAERALLWLPAGTPLELSLQRNVKTLAAKDYGVMVFYFVLMAGIGAWFARKQNSSDEFALGNRKVKWWAAGISMFATMASSISFMAIPAMTYRTNLVWLTPVFAMIPCFFLQAYVLFPLLRRMDLTSTYEYLERRFHSALRLLASFQCMALQVFGRMSVVLLLPSLAISAVTGMDVGLSVLLMGLLTTIYTSLGGFEAVIWTDVTQGVLMLFGALLMAYMAIVGLPGGWGEFVEVGQNFERFNFAILSLNSAQPILWVYLMWVLVQQVTIVSDQTAMQRVFSTPLKDVRRIAGMGLFCGISIALAVNLAGLAIFAYFHAYPEQLDPAMTNAQVVPLFIVQRLPEGIAGLIVAALFAASMSTLSSSMNSVATLASEDFYRRFRPDSTDRQRLLLMKWGSVVVGCLGTGIAYYMAQLQIESMFQVWNELLALIGGGFVGIYLLGMFTRRATSVGAMVGALGSVVSTILLKHVTDVHWVFYAPSAVLACMVIGYLVSLVLPTQSERDLTGLTVFDVSKSASEK